MLIYFKSKNYLTCGNTREFRVAPTLLLQTKHHIYSCVIFYTLLLEIEKSNSKLAWNNFIDLKSKQQM